MAWRLARSLDVLRKQIDVAYPSRSKASDGTIGDAAHASRSSDHNPWVKDGATGVVTALDITNDPAHGVDSGDIAEALRLSRNKRIKYLIADGRIASCEPMNGEPAWAWRPYHGANPHRQHFHISVKPTKSLYDDPSPWDFKEAIERLIMSAPPKTVTTPLRRFTNITATVFSGPDDAMSSGKGAYGVLDHRKPGVALPFRFKGARPKVRVFHGGKSVVCDVVDVGPWNINDDYWARPDGRPMAEQARRDSYNRIPTNDAGIDLTPAAAAAIGLKGKGKVDWEFVSADTAVAKPAAPAKDAAVATGGVAAGGAVAGTVAVGVEQGWGWQEYGLLAVCIIIAIVTGVFVLHWWRNRQADKAEVEAKERAHLDDVVAGRASPIIGGVASQVKHPDENLPVGYLDRAAAIIAADERSRRASAAGRAAVEGVIMRRRSDKAVEADKASRKPAQRPKVKPKSATGRKPKRTTANPAGKRGASR